MGLTITEEGAVSTTGAFPVVPDRNLAPLPNPDTATPKLPYSEVTHGNLGGVMYFCEAALRVGSIVQAGPSPSRLVRAATGLELGPVVGVVVSKPRDIVAQVLHQGCAPIFSGLTVGARYYLSNTGTLIALPLPGYDPTYVHFVGVAVSETTLLVQPEYPIVKRMLDA